MYQNSVHCINPDCSRPYPQPGGHRFCSSCGESLQLHNRYIPLWRLGEGGFAQIYTVWDLQTQTEKVLKVLTAEVPKAVELFEQEAQVLQSLRHPGVPRVEKDGYFQVNVTNPQIRTLPCLVMEKINGHTLEEILKKHPQGCPEAWVLDWLSQAAEILQELHSRQIIHRDIKPSNLMLRSAAQIPPPHGGGWGGQLVLIDFGGAKQFGAAMAPVASSTRLFSSGYSPPEQIAGRNVSPASDLYALGRTMIELLTGQYPAELEDPRTGALRWRSRVNVSPVLADLLDELVQDDVKLRPANAGMILQRMGRSTPIPRQPDAVSRFMYKIVDGIGLGIAGVLSAIANFFLLIFKAILGLISACFDTVRAMVLAALGASIGTFIGLRLAYSRLGLHISDFFAQYLPQLLPGIIKIDTGSDILLFALAGLGTACGLTLSGSFGQRRQYVVASIMGFFGYGLAWLLWRFTMLPEQNEGFIVLTGVAAALLTLGLGLRKHLIIHTAIAAFGSAIVGTLLIPYFLTPLDLQRLIYAVPFFSLIGMILSFWLGISYYLISPFLRLLGWR